MEKTLAISLQEQREAIAAELHFKLMPLCVCAICDNLLEGALVLKAISIVAGKR